MNDHKLISYIEGLPVARDREYARDLMQHLLNPENENNPRPYAGPSPRQQARRRDIDAVVESYFV